MRKRWMWWQRRCLKMILFSLNERNKKHNKKQALYICLAPILRAAWLVQTNHYWDKGESAHPGPGLRKLAPWGNLYFSTLTPQHPPKSPALCAWGVCMGECGELCGGSACPSGCGLQETLWAIMGQSMSAHQRCWPGVGWGSQGVSGAWCRMSVRTDGWAAGRAAHTGSSAPVAGHHQTATYILTFRNGGSSHGRLQLSLQHQQDSDGEALSVQAGVA